MANIVVPELGDSVIEATIIRWNKQEGDTVKIGETVVELETEKANFEVAAEQSGVLQKIEKQANEDVEVGDVLGSIDESKSEAAPKTEEKQPEKEAEPKEETLKQEAKEEKPAKEEPKHEEAEEKTDEGIRITPVAKQIAQQNNVDLSKVTPSGTSNRITKEDVEEYIKKESEQERKAKEETVKQPETGEDKEKFDPGEFLPSISRFYADREQRVKMTRRRRTIARRMKEAQQTAAILTTFNEIDMSAVMDLRKRRKDAFKEKHGVSLGLSSFFVKAAIGALKVFPEVNAEIQGEEIVYKNYFDIGIAIGAEEGLVVPVIREADRKSFAQIEREVRELAEKANEGQLTMDDLMGGTFTITNGGVYGSMLSTPILNPPQVGILGLHKIEDRPVVVNGEIEIRPVMFVALSYDHRIVDGREAVQFLVKIKELIEDPENLLIEG